MPPLNSEFTSRWTRPGWLWAGLLAMLAFLPSLNYPFLSDDIPQVEKNGRLVPPVDWSRVVWSPHWPEMVPQQPLWRPGLQVSLAVNRWIAGPTPRGFHLVNILLHGMVAALVWGFVRSLGGRESTSTLAALLFALHPVHTEAVVSIVGRAEMQMTLFVLATCAAGFGAIRRGSLPLLLLCGLAYALAFFSKEQGFLAPGFLLVGAIALLFNPAGRHAPNGEEELRKKEYIHHLAWTLFFLGAIGLAGLSLRFRLFGWDQSFHKGNVTPLVNPLVEIESAWVRAVTGLRMFGRGLALTLWPLHLSPDYSSPSVVPGAAPVWKTILSAAALALLVCLSILLFVSGHGKRANTGPASAAGERTLAALGILFFLGFYLPVTNILTLNGTIFAERMLYLPSVGACLALAVGVEAGWGRASVYFGAGESGRNRARLAAVVCVLIGLSWCWKSEGPWRSARTWAEQATRTAPHSAHAHYGLASALYDQGDWEGAARESRTAIRLWPSDAGAWHMLGIASLELKDYPRAEEALRKAIALDPGLKASYNSLGNALALRGRPEEALRYFFIYQRMGPEDPAALRRKIEFTRRRIEEAQSRPAAGSAPRRAD